ncbi:MAG: ATP-binding cassette domain-containing protein [Alphaproteobacteria bacterium]|nr:ATP-binding cassette domain-containing protein [Alphaproteobacteria bacterium]
MLTAGQTTVLVGTSGSGKSTLLRMLAGLEDVPENIRLDGLPSGIKRAYMTQDVRLLPWFTVERNVGIGDQLRGEAIDHAGVAHKLEQLDLVRDAQKYPGQISGGMAQRAALARTLLEGADLNLLDEPFAALDAITRRNMQDLVKQHFRGKTVVLVTHDPMEAVRLGDAIYVLAQSEPDGPAAFTPFTKTADDAPARAEQLFKRLQTS